MFSKAAAQLHGEQNVLYAIREELKNQGHVIQDLVSGNINEQGFLFPPEILDEVLSKGLKQCRIYKPDSFGQRDAREAVSEFYRERNHKISPENILITPGSSLSYLYCFKLLADEGDEILCPCPSYPLFDYIALLSGVKLIPYKLDENRDWAIDIEQLESSISTKTRALVIISPHNPTGHLSSPEEIKMLAEVACRHDLAIISDEVFSEFLFRDDGLPRPDPDGAPLIITLNGFSKMFALPGIKFGWMAVSGRPERVRQAMRALEMISDTFLPVNEIVQAAAPEIFRYGRKAAADFADRIHACWKTVRGLLHSTSAFTFTEPGGGFYATLHLAHLDEKHVTETVLRENHLLIHPGYFYDMEPDHLVVCFVQASAVLQGSFPSWIKTIDSMANRASQ